MCRNESKLILRAFFARSPDVSTVLVRYYLLGSDTAAPSGLYARQCHAFLVAFYLDDPCTVADLSFLPRDAMLSAVYAVVVCLCVCHTPVLYQNG